MGNEIHLQDGLDIKLLDYAYLTEADSDSVLEMRNHFEVRQWMRNEAIISKSQHNAFMSNLAKEVTAKYYLVVQSNNKIGTINFTSINLELMTAEVGLYGNPLSFQKKKGGLLIQSLVYCAQMMGLKMLKLEVFQDNKRAIGLYLKSGFEIVESRNNLICMKLVLTDGIDNR